MIDQEFNEKIAQLIAMVQFEGIFSNVSIDEHLGKWDELLEDREGKKESFDTLFSFQDDELTEDNRLAIADLRSEAYPQLLCQLGKCYIAKERYSDATTILQEAADLGFIGGQILLGIAYFNGRQNNSDVQRAFSLLNAGDILSEEATKQIDNVRFQASAQFYLAVMYRIVAKDTMASYNSLLRIINTDWDEDLKGGARQELSHFKKSLFGGLKYVE